jgi:hypothetical protein
MCLYLYISELLNVMFWLLMYLYLDVQMAEWAVWAVNVPTYGLSKFSFGLFMLVMCQYMYIQ